MKKIFTTMLIVLCLIGLSVGPASAQDSDYILIDIGTLGPEAPESYPFDMNDLGQVVGESYGGAFLWDSETGMQNLSQTLGIYGQAIYINNQGQVVGNNPTFLWSPSDGYIQLTNTSSYPGGVNNLGQVVGEFNVIVDDEIEQTHAFLWNKDTGIQDLGTLAGNTWNSVAMAVDINDYGQVVGWSNMPTGVGSHAFRWTQETGMQDLGFYVDTLNSALVINSLGEIAGSRFIDGSHVRGFLWTPEKGVIDLGTLGSLPDSESKVQGMNDQGQVIGWSDTTSGYRHAFRWTPEKGMEDLGTLGGNASAAYAINNLGQIVGRSNLPSGERHAFVWTEKDGMMDLGTLEGGDSAAYGINSSGQIIGTSDKFYGGGYGFRHAVFWQPASTNITIDIKIDIKPGSSTNPINLGAKGVIPVAVLTTDEFDASDLDPSTVLFAAAPPLRWSKQDVDYDGEMDLLFHFDVQKLQLSQSSVEASLTGKTYAGTPVEGADQVKIVPVVSGP